MWNCHSFKLFVLVEFGNYIHHSTTTRLDWLNAANRGTALQGDMAINTTQMTLHEQ